VDQVKDGRVDAMGCVGPFYPLFAVFDVLGLSDILVFYPINRTLQGCTLYHFSNFHMYFLN
jgi:hypothetical protein